VSAARGSDAAVERQLRVLARRWVDLAAHQQPVAPPGRGPVVGGGGVQGEHGPVVAPLTVRTRPGRAAFPRPVGDQRGELLGRIAAPVGAGQDVVAAGGERSFSLCSQPAYQQLV
jgi:hypothetical protein